MAEGEQELARWKRRAQAFEEALRAVAPHAADLIEEALADDDDAEGLDDRAELCADDLDVTVAADQRTITITHKPTGLSAKCGRYKSQIGNRVEALRRLRRKVALR